MNKIHVLDCTLRDGGYCNQWQFGFENIRKITEGLVEAGIDVIECGFLTNRVSYNRDVTLFNTIEELAAVIPANRENKLFVAMVNYGECDIDSLPICDGTSIDGIRVAFHKKDLEESMKWCQQIQDKGYKVFVQPMVSLCYSDEEFLDLIHQANELKPYAFYIVDSFGMMKNRDLTRLFDTVERNLDNGIWIGFHSHNNMQLAYSNAQTLVGIPTNRDLLIDSSVYGMGRGAGNLNTELFIEFLNENADKEYWLKPLLTIIDEILNEFYQRNYWGYSLPNYISAAHNAHPNYAGYLDDKKTLTVENMDEIFALMDEERKFSFDKAYIEELYEQYMATGKVQEEHAAELKKELEGKKVLLIAPGKSAVEEKNRIFETASAEDVITVSINYEYPYTDIDYMFLSNLRRFRELRPDQRTKCIVTSNIPADTFYLKTRYKDLVNKVEAVHDNAGMMAIKFLMKYGVEEILLAGFDGYSHDELENYGDSQMAFTTKNVVLDAMNIGMTKVLSEYSKNIKLTFLTEPRHIMF